MKEKATPVRYKINPFVENMTINTKNKQVRIAKISDSILVDTTTGVSSTTHLVSVKKVDKSKFVKVFAENIALTFGLTAAGIKSFGVLMDVVSKTESINKDQVLLDQYSLKDFNEKNDMQNFSIPTFQRGLKELENAQIIAKTIRKGWYFINPNFVFNGDRIVFSTIIEAEEEERKSKKIGS